MHIPTKKLLTPFSGGVTVRTERDRFGREVRKSVRSGGIERGAYRYEWGIANRLLAKENELTGTLMRYDYDRFDFLIRQETTDGSETDVIYRVPDFVGNLFETPERKDRKYGAGGRLLEDPDCFYHYDDEGNLIFREFKELQDNAVPHDRKRMEKERGIRCRAMGMGWLYEWASNGMLKKVVRPDGRPVEFRYDALGRRTAKRYFGKVTRWVWDGNVPLHEWSYKAIGIQSDEEENTPPKEPADDITTWLFEADTFVPAAKILGDKQYSIVSDYMGTPIQMYDGQGNKTWDCTLDIYGKVLAVDKGTEFDCPFRFQGQYADEETGLYYNRFRYYLPNFGGYISQDPINLKGGIKFYSYVSNPTIWLDILGLFHHNDTGFYVYGLFDIIDIDEKGQFIFADTPYYIGITNNLPVRAGQHRASGRLGKNNYMRPLEEKVTYGQARGYEQAYIEYYGTKTGIINEKISAVNRGNKINSFDINNTTRARDRHQCFTENRENKLNELASKDKHH